MNPAPVLDRSLALRLILLLGIVSLFGDIIYEGSRSIAGPYLLLLGASAFTVALVAGFGEFLGYAARLGWFIQKAVGDLLTLAVVGILGYVYFS